MFFNLYPTPHFLFCIAPFVNPVFATTHDLDYAGKAPATFVRIGSNDNDVAISTDSGVRICQLLVNQQLGLTIFGYLQTTWSPYSGDGS